MPTRVAGSRLLAMGHYQPAPVQGWEGPGGGPSTRAARPIAVTATLVDMASAAAGRALAASGLSGADVDLVVVATCTSIDRVPNVACRVAERLGVDAPGAYDVNTVCSGFSYALATVDHAIRADAARTAIVVGADKMSDFVDWTDEHTAGLFADGAGAAVVTAVTGDGPPGIGPVVWGSGPDPDAAAMRIEGWRPTVTHDSERLLRWVEASLAPLARETCARAGVHPDDVRALVVQQEDTRIVDALAARLDLPHAVVAREVAESGNTTAAAVPLALSRLVERGAVPPGAPVLLFGFGGDHTYAGQVVRCP